MAEMSLEQRQYLTAKFEEFVAAVHSDVKENQPVRKPYQWQIRLMLHVAEHGCWPQGIGAPTASGKTSVIDIHVFLNAMAGLISTEESADTQILADLPLQRIPRRLALTVNRRSLVDDQFDEACALQNKMQSENDKDDGLDVYRKGLNLRSAVNDGIKRELPNPQMIVVELRGGASPDREWRYYPQTCAVICATPDMFGSRLLFRGYGTSATMRSMEAGLLAYDTVLIADEAHLSRQLLRTARQVTRIENMAMTSLTGQVTSLQVVETTATPTSDDVESLVSVRESDFGIDSALRKRLCTSKPVFTSFDFGKPKDEIEAIALRCFELIQDNEKSDRSSDSNPHVLGCILNTVENAKAVAKELDKRCKKEGIQRPIDVYVGPMRAYDKRKVAERLKSVPSMNPQNAPCCIIGTQTLEVGVDVDFANMVTEIAPGSALVQRAGRVNRRGLRSSGPVYVFGLDLRQSTEKKQTRATIPYSPEDIQKTRDWLNALSKTESGDPDISAWSVNRTVLAGTPTPGERQRRLLFQRLEPWDVENLSVTDEELCADISESGLQQGHSDLNLWLRDELNSDDPDVSIVVRHLPWDGTLATQLLEVTQPENDELFPVGKWCGLESLFKTLARQDDKAHRRGARIDTVNIRGEKSTVEFPHRVFRYRASEPEGHRVVCLRAQDAAQNTVKSGDVLILDDYEKVFSKFSEDSFETAVIFDPEGSDSASDVFNRCTSSALITDSSVSDDSRVAKAFRFIQKIEEEESSENGEELSDTAEEDMQESLRLLRAATVGAVDSAGRAENKEYSLIWHVVEGPEVRYTDIGGNAVQRNVQWVVSGVSESMPDSESNQEILSSRKKTLFLGGISSDPAEPRRKEGHQNHVARRAQALGTLIGLGPMMVEDLRIAGEYHDEGKKDKRFQRMLCRNRQKEIEKGPWAKSRLFISRSWEQEFRNTYRLHGWRHEQRSVVEFLYSCEKNEQLAIMSEPDKQLVERLIGTSHGHGRSAFRHGTEYLLPQEGGASRNANPRLNDISDRLFEMGEWETLIDRTNQRYGFWGVSYLEALLRAADITCSKEGL